MKKILMMYADVILHVHKERINNSGYMRQEQCIQNVAKEGMAEEQVLQTKQFCRLHLLE